VPPNKALQAPCRRLVAAPPAACFARGAARAFWRRGDGDEGELGGGLPAWRSRWQSARSTRLKQAAFMAAR
jgi:hypothetical protein